MSLGGRGLHIIEGIFFGRGGQITWVEKEGGRGLVQKNKSPGIFVCTVKQRISDHMTVGSVTNCSDQWADHQFRDINS